MIVVGAGVVTFEAIAHHSLDTRVPIRIVVVDDDADEWGGCVHVHCVRRLWAVSLLGNQRPRCESLKPITPIHATPSASTSHSSVGHTTPGHCPPGFRPGPPPPASSTENPKAFG